MLITLLSKYQYQYHNNWRSHYKPRTDGWIWDLFLKGIVLIFWIFVISILWILIKAIIDAFKR